MWNTGYQLKEIDKIADVDGKRTKALFQQAAKTYTINIVGGSVATKKNDGFYNTMYVVNRKGEIVSEYDKAHLFPLMDEPKFYNKVKATIYLQLMISKPAV